MKEHIADDEEYVFKPRVDGRNNELSWALIALSIYKSWSL